MLKSVPTQFAATLFFGPLGLAYCSVAAAVFFTLVLAVLLFTEIGLFAVFLMWPVSILVGLVFVKFHNDGIRSSGSRLLLAPGEEMTFAGTDNAWARGLSVIALLATAGYLVYLYLPESADSGDQPGRIVDAQTGTETRVIPGEGSTSDGDSVNTGATVIAANSQNDGNDNFAVIALPQREVATIVLDRNGEVTSGQSQSMLNRGQPELTVNGSVVNLRQGPGTNFAVVTQVEQGDRLFEYARDGQWINVEAVATGHSGWIFSSLVK